MPNRIIKESICTSKDIDKLTPEEEIQFYRIWVNCDDFGRMIAEPEIVRSKCFPWRVDKIKISLVESWLKKLNSTGLIILYTHHDTLYLQVAKWEEHQQIRASKSKYPSLDDDESELISNEINCNQLKPVIDNSDSSRISSTNTITSTNTIIKINYADFVKLTQQEYDKLVEEFGDDGTKERINNLNLYKGSKGIKYKSDYMTILNWERKHEQEQKPSNKQRGKVTQLDMLREISEELKGAG